MVRSSSPDIAQLLTPLLQLYITLFNTHFWTNFPPFSLSLLPSFKTLFHNLNTSPHQSHGAVLTLRSKRNAISSAALFPPFPTAFMDEFLAVMALRATKWSWGWGGGLGFPTFLFYVLTRVDLYFR
jgi:hypothetical protein